MSKLNQTILVPVGFSDQSLLALEQAVHVAKILKAELTLLSVIEESGFFARVFGDNDDEVMFELKKKAQAKLEELAEDIRRKNKLDVNTLVSKGKVYQKIVEASEMIDASYIVMGTDGQPKDFQKKLIGSNAFRVVSTANCPVITIKGTEHYDGCKRIVLPLDLEKETKEKVKYAVNLGRLWNATINIVSVVASSDEEDMNRLKGTVRQVQKYITDRGLECNSELVVKPKGQRLVHTILDYAIEKNADLVVIMTQQELDYTPNFIGSSAQSIIYNSNIPVMSIRPIVSDKYKFELPSN